ncbi:hypothetical protein Dimus_021613, partial [Dionaea muscipula]
MSGGLPETTINTAGENTNVENQPVTQTHIFSDCSVGVSRNERDERYVSQPEIADVSEIVVTPETNTIPILEAESADCSLPLEVNSIDVGPITKMEPAKADNNSTEEHSPLSDSTDAPRLCVDLQAFSPDNHIIIHFGESSGNISVATES